MNTWHDVMSICVHDRLAWNRYFYAWIIFCYISKWSRNLI